MFILPQMLHKKDDFNGFNKRGITLTGCFTCLVDPDIERGYSIFWQIKHRMEPLGHDHFGSASHY